MSRKLDLIKLILTEHPVTDPRGALMAIEKVLATKKVKPKNSPTNLLTLSVDRIATGKVAIGIKFDRDKLKGRHIDMLHDSIDKFAEDTFGPPCEGCEECDPMKEMVKGDTSASPLGEPFRQFEAEARKTTGIDPKKGH